MLRISLVSSLTASLLVAGLAQPVVAQTTSVAAAGATAPGEAAPLDTDDAPKASFSKRNYSISPDRPGLNVTFSAELVATAFVSNQLTQRFIAFPSPGFKLATSFPLFGRHVFLDGESRQLSGSAITRCHGYLQNFGNCMPSGNVPRFSAQEWIIEERGGVRVGRTPLHLGIATFYSATNFGFPDLLGLGVGAEVRPNYTRTVSTFGRIYYYSNLTNEDGYSNPGSALPATLRYGMARYELGFSKKLGKSRQTLQAGIDGSSTWRLVNAPTSMTKVKLFVASGLRF